MSLESEAALLWSTPNLKPAEVVRLRELLHARLDWSEVLGILATHRTMGVAWHNLLQHLIEERGALLPTYLFKALEVMYKGQLVMAREQIAYSIELLDALSAAGIPCALLKGGAMARMAYPSLGMRVFNDNDLLVETARLAEAGDILRKVGYEQGSWNYGTGTVRPARRSDIMLYPVSSHQTHPYMRPTPSATTLECHRVDLHFSVDLLTSNRTDTLVTDLLSRRVALGDPPLWTLDPVDMAVFGCVHFYKEAIYYNEVARLKDLVLYKLVDVLALLEKPDAPVDPDALASRAIDMGVAEQVYFSLFNLNELFPGHIPGGLLATLRPDTVDYLHEVVDDQNHVYRWAAPVAERFFDSQRFLKLGGAVTP
jgi:hypothetical protein